MDAIGEAIRGIVELLHGFGPGIAGYILAIAALGLCLFVMGHGIRSYNRAMSGAVKMSEDLRESMRKEKIECERECKRLREINDQLRLDRDELIRQHSAAREEFLQEAREREHIQLSLLRDLESIREKLNAANTKAEVLHSELDAIRAGTRNKPRE